MSDWIGTWADWSIELLGAREIHRPRIGYRIAARTRKEQRRPGSERGHVRLYGSRRAITRWRMFRSDQEARDAVEVDE
jgi:hypothetical protein